MSYLCFTLHAAWYFALRGGRWGLWIPVFDRTAYLSAYNGLLHCILILSNTLSLYLYTLFFSWPWYTSSVAQIETIRSYQSCPSSITILYRYFLLALRNVKISVLYFIFFSGESIKQIIFFEVLIYLPLMSRHHTIMPHSKINSTL